MNVIQAGDIRELSFQNVVDQILKPNNVNVGGFPDDIFVDLTEEEKEQLICNICFMIVNEPRQCQNEHLFCHTCIFAWSMTYGENSQKCPMCRSDQKEYEENKKVSRLLQDKRVSCPEEKCSFKAPLKIFLMHNHGKAKYANGHVDLEALRPSRPEGARLLVLPNISISGSTRQERAQSIRGQLQQGRMMIHQMMLLLHLEMQLRQQAVTSFQQATDPTTRLSRLDEVMALNEQLNEVGTVLSTMLNSPINSIMAANRVLREVGHVTARDTPSPFPWQSPPQSARRGSRRITADDDDDEDDDDSSSSDTSVIDSLHRNYLARQRGNATNHGTSTSSSYNVSNSGGGMQRDRSLRRSEIRESLLNRTSSNTNTNDDDIPVISQGRHLSDYAQASMPSTDIHPRVLMGRDQSNQTSASRPVNATQESTQRLGSATGPTQRNSISTTVNSRNQTLPNLQANSSSSNTDNSVSRSRQDTTLHTPRPPSSQPSETNEPDAPRSSLPNGSSAFSRVRNSLQNSRSHNSNSENRTENTSARNGVTSTTVSWHSGTNTGSTPRISNPTPRRSGQTEGQQGGDTPRNTTVTRRSQPALISADLSALPNSVARQRVQSGVRRSVSNENEASQTTRGLPDGNTIQVSSSGNVTTRNTTTNRVASLNRATERRPTLSEGRPNRTNTSQTSNGHPNQLRGGNITRRNSNTVTESNTITSRSQNSNPNRQANTTRRSVNAPPKQRTASNQAASGTSGSNATRGTTGGGPLLRARRRSDIRQDLRRSLRPQDEE